MAKEYRKIVQAGSLWMAVQYTAIRGGTAASRRQAKSQISDPAREKLNAKLSKEKLRFVLAANFQQSDLVVGLDYRDECLPKTREAADKRLTAFIRELRAYRKARGQTLVYVRVTEGYHSDNRLHHHLICNSTGDDYAIIRKLWARNADTVDFEWFGEDGMLRWSEYLTKEPIQKGRRHVGDRTWRASIRMKKPTITTELVDAKDRLQAPEGAKEMESNNALNQYGRFEYLLAILPEGAKLHP